jgi:hypothetical protein
LRNALVGAFAVLAISAPVATAATSIVHYPPRESTRTFNNANDWSFRALFGGVCIPVLICPTLTPTFETTGGGDGPNDGWIKLSIADIAAAASNARGIWESRTFKYKGVANERPQKVRFSLDRNTDLTALIAAQGRARYDVEMVDVTKGGTIANTIFKDRNLGVTKGFVHEGPFTVGRNVLQIGHKYYVRIVSRFDPELQVLQGGFTGYDNVDLTAKRKTVTPPKKGQGNRHPG